MSEYTIFSRYEGDLRCYSQHQASGSELKTDAPVDNHGLGEDFSPTDLVATALANCMLTLMGIYARKNDISIEKTEAHVTKIMGGPPRRIKEIQVEFYFQEDIQLSLEQKEALELAARTCPVSLSIHPEITQTLAFHYPAHIPTATL